MTTYTVRIAPLGWAIVMTDDEGFESAIEVGIKRLDSALKKQAMWEKREATASAKEAKRVAKSESR